MKRAITLGDLVEARFLRACSQLVYERIAPAKESRPWVSLSVDLAGAHVGWVLRHYIADDVFLVTAAPHELDGRRGDEPRVWKRYPHARLWTAPDWRTGLHEPAVVLRALIALDGTIDLPLS